MSFDDFMNDPYMDEVGGGDFKTIARAIVQPAFQGWQFGANPQTWEYDGSKEGALIAREKCAGYCQGNNSFPQAGLLTTVFGDDIPTHPDGAKDGDWLDFVPVFHSREKYTGSVDVIGEFPYDLVLAGVKANPGVFNTVQWVELSRPIDNIREPKRDKENSKYAHRVYVVERIFKNREEAYSAAGVPLTDNKSASDALAIDFSGEDINGLSKTAINNGWNVAALKEQGEAIHAAIAAATKGENTPKNKEMNLEQARNFVCDNFALEPSDLQLLDVEAPF